MKKGFYLLAAAVLFTACNNGNQYTITGNIEDAKDGSPVYLLTEKDRELVTLDSTVVKGGAFTFKGEQDTAIVCHLTCNRSEKGNVSIDFFLENGNIQINLSKGNESATGTPNNNIYQEIRVQISDLNKQMRDVYESMTQANLSDEQRQEAAREMETVENKKIELIKSCINQNIDMPTGIHLLKQNYYYLDVNMLDSLMPKIPANYNNDRTIIKIKENVEKMKATAVGQKFTDFEMASTDGKTVKLSDYVGKGKVVLVDFWASWCGPCRREMPNLIDAYQRYKNKNFEIVGVSLDQSAEAWKEGIKKLKLTWPQMSDLKFWDCEGAKLYAVNSIPHTVLIDTDGTIVARGLHGDELQKTLEELLK